MPDSWKDEKGELIVDLGSQNRSSRGFKDRKGYTEYGDVDLASGYPKNMIWTTKDGRRIAIPNMSDSHLLNTIAFIRRRGEIYKKQVAVQMLTRSVFHIQMFDENMFGSEELEEWYNELSQEAQKVWDMPNDAFLRKYMPIFVKLLSEAYKRKILIEVDKTKVTDARQAPKPKVKPVKPVKPAETDVTEMTWEEQVEAMYQAAVSTGGMEVQREWWDLAEAVCKEHPDCSLGSARGPNNQWKRLRVEDDIEL